MVDATNETLGRFSSKVAKILRGKHKPSFTPHVDCGDYVVIINAEKIKLTGKKFENKEYVSHSGYPGGQKIKTAIADFQKFVPSNLPNDKLDIFEEHFENALGTFALVQKLQKTEEEYNLFAKSLHICQNWR